MRISDRRGIFGRNEVKQKGGKSRGIKAYRLLCPIRSQCCTNYNAPTGALDSASAKQLLSMLAELNEQDRSTILMVTHDPFSASFGNRVLFIKDGNLKKEIDKGQHNRNDFYQTILSEISAFGGE